jgi:hypothetical protein
MDVNNKTLAVLLIVGMVLSIGGTLTVLNIGGSPTGFAITDLTNGTVNYDIDTNVLVNFTVATIDWGSGTVDTGSGENNCTMETTATANSAACDTFNSLGAGAGFTLENIGNNNVSVNLTFQDAIATFLPLSTTGESALWYKVNDGAESACVSETSTYTAVADINPHEICTEMDYVTAHDEFDIDIKIAIDYQESGTSKTMDVQADAYLI